MLCADVGFAVMSFRENRWGGLLAQGRGTCACGDSSSDVKETEITIKI